MITQAELKSAREALLWSESLIADLHRRLASGEPIEAGAEFALPKFWVDEKPRPAEWHPNPLLIWSAVKGAKRQVRLVAFINCLRRGGPPKTGTTKTV